MKIKSETVHQLLLSEVDKEILRSAISIIDIAYKEFKKCNADELSSDSPLGSFFIEEIYRAEQVLEFIGSSFIITASTSEEEPYHCCEECDDNDTEEPEFCLDDFINMILG